MPEMASTSRFKGSVGGAIAGRSPDTGMFSTCREEEIEIGRCNPVSKARPSGLKDDYQPNKVSVMGHEKDNCFRGCVPAADLEDDQQEMSKGEILGSSWDQIMKVLSRCVPRMHRRFFLRSQVELVGPDRS